MRGNAHAWLNDLRTTTSMLHSRSAGWYQRANLLWHCTNALIRLLKVYKPSGGYRRSPFLCSSRFGMLFFFFSNPFSCALGYRFNVPIISLPPCTGIPHFYYSEAGSEIQRPTHRLFATAPYTTGCKEIPYHGSDVTPDQVCEATVAVLLAHLVSSSCVPFPLLFHLGPCSCLCMFSQASR